MNDMLKFDAARAKAIDTMYQNPDITGQRAETLRWLQLAPGENVLDIGAGPGLLLYDMALLIGAQGKAMGFDTSQPMLDIAANRCGGLDCVELKHGDATNLPFADNQFDAAVSTQVYEYVADMTTALAELYRVMKPGGRILILDTDWDSAVINVSNRALHDKVMQAWDEHLADPHLPATLTPKLRAAGFTVIRRDAYPIINHEYQPNSFAWGMLRGIRDYVIGRQGITEADARAWFTDIETLAHNGAFFFSINRYLFLAVK